MAKPKLVKVDEKAASGIEFRDPPVFRGGRGAARIWWERISPLLDHQNRWAMVHAAPTPQSARNAVANLKRRLFMVPPGQWEFRSSGCEVFARYLGPEEHA